MCDDVYVMELKLGGNAGCGMPWAAALSPFVSA